MFIISTRNFPPEVGGMQNLMGGLANALINHGPVKVFADKFEGSDRTLGLQMKSVGEVMSIGSNFQESCLLYTSPSPRDGLLSRMPSSA